MKHLDVTHYICSMVFIKSIAYKLKFKKRKAPNAHDERKLDGMCKTANCIQLKQRH